MNPVRGSAVGFLSLLLVQPWLAGCSSSPAGRDPEVQALATQASLPPRSVRVARPEPVEEAYPSNLYVERDVRLTPRRTGIIERVLVDRGARVRQGQILAVLETDLAAGELMMAEQEHRLAQAEYDRKRLLHDGKIVSAEDFLRCETARDLAASRADLARARLERCNIRAPFDGIVLERWARVGQRVQEDEDIPLFRVVAEDALRARVDVPEERLSALHVGAAAAIETVGEPSPHPARVVFVSPAVDPGSGTTPVIVETLTRAGLRPGASVRVRFEEALGERSAFRIPREALAEGMNVEGRSVTILVAEGGRAAARQAKVIESIGAFVLVTGEIRAGDRVIVLTGADLKPGDPIELREEVL